MFGIVRQPIVSIRSILSLQSSAISTAVRNTTQCSFHKQSVASKWSSQIAQHQTLRSIVQQHGPVSRAISLKKCSRPLFNQSKLFFSNSTTKTQPRNTGPNNRQQEYREYDDYEIVQRSAFRLLFPSFVFAAGVTIVSWTVALNYYPNVSQHDRSRLFPDFSVGTATAVGIIGINLVVFGLWHLPSIAGTMLKYFTTMSIQPTPISMLGAVFSHATSLHLLFNMYGVWAFGSQLCDELGRPNFLALYLSAGVLSSWASIAWNVLIRSHNVGLGASGAIFGLFAAWTYMHSNAQIGVIFLPIISFPAKNVLIAATSYEIAALIAGWQPFLGHMAHLSGIVFGLGMMHLLYQHLLKARRKEVERRL